MQDNDKDTIAKLTADNAALRAALQDFSARGGYVSDFRWRITEALARDA